MSYTVSHLKFDIVPKYLMQQHYQFQILVGGYLFSGVAFAFGIVSLHKHETIYLDKYKYSIIHAYLDMSHHCFLIMLIK